MPRRTIERLSATNINVIDMNTGKYIDASAIPYICSAIRHYRMSLGIEQKELAERIGVHKNAISNWERGRSRPDFNLIEPLCKELQITPYELLGIGAPDTLFTEREERLVGQYRKLEPKYRAHVDSVISSLLQIQDEESVPDLYEIRFQPFRLAAGSDAAIRDITESEKLWLHDTPLLRRATSVYKVNGDSMEPTFRDGDLVFVEDIPDGTPIHFGEIGAFAIGNETYIKEYQKDGLHSHNAKYDVMHFDEDASVYLIGRVLGDVDSSLLATESEIKRFINSKKTEE